MDTEKPKFIARSVSVGVGSIAVKGGLLRNKTIIHEDKFAPDYTALCEKIAEAYNQLDALGYSVVNVLPINVGEMIDNKDSQFGISVTRGAVVVGKLNPA